MVVVAVSALAASLAAVAVEPDVVTRVEAVLLRVLASLDSA